MKNCQDDPHQVLRDRLLYPYVKDPNPPGSVKLANLEANWPQWFIDAMRDRMRMGMLRYGSLKKQTASGTGYDNLGSARLHISEYQKTGNIEHLIDAANLVMIEAETGYHPTKHFKAIDDGRHTKHRG